MFYLIKINNFIYLNKNSPRKYNKDLFIISKSNLLFITNSHTLPLYITYLLNYSKTYGNRCEI